MSNIQLRDYQLEALEAVNREYKSKVRKQLIVLPTGTGKTIIFSAIAKDWNVRTLILAHRDELINQAVDKLKLFWADADVGVVKADRAEYDHQVVVGSVQSCMHKKRLARLKEQNFQLLIVDEAHHAAANSYQKIIKKLGFLRNSGKQLLLGFTATPDRCDKLGLGDTFQKIVFMRSISTMIDQGYLSKILGRRCLTSISLDKVRTTHGDFQIGDLAAAVNVQERNAYVVDKFLEYAKDRKAVAFCTDVQHCHDLAAAFNARGIPAKAVWGAMPIDDRRQTLTELKDGTIKVCTSCGVLTEGWDESSINCVLMARPTKSRGLYVQCIGRGLRLAVDKTDCLVIDYADEGHDLNSIMSLRKTMPELAIMRERHEQHITDKMDIPTSVPQEEVYDGSFDILGKSAFLWIDIGDGEFSLMDDDHAEIILTPVDGDRYMAYLWKDKVRENILDKPLPLDYARGVSEDYARQHLKIKYCESHTWLYGSSYRQPTEGQIKLLARYNISADGMSKAQAATKIREQLALHSKYLRQHGYDPITENQKFYLKSKGVKTDGLTKLEAMKMISLLKKGIHPSHGGQQV